MNAPPRPTPHSLRTEGRPLMDITAVALLLGVNVRHVRRLVFENRLPYIKWGHLLRFDPADIDTWLDDHRRGDTLA